MSTFFRDEDVAAAFPEFTISFPELGSGTFKVAYQAVAGEAPVVLKVVKAVIDPDEEALPIRLDREISAMKRIDSEYIVPILAGPELRTIGPAQHLFYLEPLFAQGTLDSVIGRPQPLTFVRQLADDLLGGIEALWAHRIVHRDIKPGNVALNDGRAILLDLGIAYFTDLTPATDEFGSSPRTSRYAALEQFEVRRLAEIDHRTDQFLTGLVLFECLTGSHPFDPDEPSGYFKRIEDGEITQRPLDDAAVPEPVRAFLARLLAAAPNGRFRTPELARRSAQEAFA